jgi:hypothetical protein
VAARPQPAERHAGQGDFPDFDDNLRQAFERELKLFVASIIREDRNVLDLMTADYTFVNERLAQHYGIPNVYGPQFRRVTLADDARKGLLGKGAVLLVTSHADRTSPVVRGKWILDNLLGAPPPPPPAGGAAARRFAGRRHADDAAADGEAPREPGVRELPQGDGPDSASPWRTSTPSGAGATWTASRRSTPRAC